MNIKLYAAALAVTPWLLLSSGCCDTSSRCPTEPKAKPVKAARAGSACEVYGDLVYRVGDSWSNSKAVTMVAGISSRGGNTIAAPCLPCPPTGAPVAAVRPVQMQPAFVSQPLAKSSCSPTIGCAAVNTPGVSCTATDTQSACFTLSDSELKSGPQIFTPGIAEVDVEKLSKLQIDIAPSPEVKEAAKPTQQSQAVAQPALPPAAPIQAPAFVMEAAPAAPAAPIAPEAVLPEAVDVKETAKKELEVIPAPPPEVAAPALQKEVAVEEIIEKDLAPPALEVKAPEMPLELMNQSDSAAPSGLDGKKLDEVDSAQTAKSREQEVLSITNDTTLELPSTSIVTGQENTPPAAVTPGPGEIGLDLPPLLSDEEAAALEASFFESERRLGDIPTMLDENATEAATPNEEILSQVPSKFKVTVFPSVEMPPELK